MDKLMEEIEVPASFVEECAAHIPQRYREADNAIETAMERVLKRHLNEDSAVPEYRPKDSKVPDKDEKLKTIIGHAAFNRLQLMRKNAIGRLDYEGTLEVQIEMLAEELAYLCSLSAEYDALKVMNLVKDSVEVAAAVAKAEAEAMAKGEYDYE